ncbi:hypothetical protein D3C80_1490650 [compost metagenome]
MFDELIDRALQGADGRGRHGPHENLAKWQAKQRRAVHRIARAVLHEAVQRAVRAVFGHKRVFDEDVMGAGGFQPHHIPVIENLVITARQQEGPVIRCSARLLRRHHGAEENPVTMFAAG